MNVHSETREKTAESGHEKVMHCSALAGRVLRYHTWPTLHQQTVGEHSARVAALYLRVYGLPRAEVLAHCVQHDDGELQAGDVPFYSKRLSVGLAGAVNLAEEIGRHKLRVPEYVLTEEERVRFKSCDLLEMYEFGLVETRMGNSYGRVVVDNVRVALEKLVGTGRASEMMLMVGLEVGQ